MTLGKLSEGGERLVRGVPGARGWLGRWVRPLTRGLLSRDGPERLSYVINAQE